MKLVEEITRANGRKETYTYQLRDLGNGQYAWPEMDKIIDTKQNAVCLKNGKVDRPIGVEFKSGPRTIKYTLRQE